MKTNYRTSNASSRSPGILTLQMKTNFVLFFVVFLCFKTMNKVKFIVFIHQTKVNPVSTRKIDSFVCAIVIQL